VPPIWPSRGALELPAPRPEVCEVEKESTGLVHEVGIPYENRGPVALGGIGVVATTRDWIRPLCDVEAVNTMVAQNGDGGLGGGNSHVVTTIVGIEELPEGVTTTLSGTCKGESV
jgi:hypothetical protein